MARPVDVTVIAIFQLLLACFFVVAGMVLLVQSADTGHPYPKDSLTKDLEALFVIIGLGSIIVGLLECVSAFGLWKLKRWAPAMTLILTAISFLAKLNGWFIFVPFNFLGIFFFVVLLIWDVSIFIHLSRPSSRMAFQSSRRS